MLQSNIIPIPKSTHVERMRQNIDIFDFKVNADEMKKIEGLNEEKSFSALEISGFTGEMYYRYLRFKERLS